MFKHMLLASGEALKLLEVCQSSFLKLTTKPVLELIQKPSRMSLGGSEDDGNASVLPLEAF